MRREGSVLASVQNERKVFSVSELAAKIKAVLGDELSGLWVEGEISNLRRPASGHAYFTLKDEGAQVRAAFFRGAQASCSLVLKDGLKIRAYGSIDMYEKSGDVQLIVRRAEPAGLGDLQAAFEALKKRLAAEGLFEQARKRPLPVLPRSVGVVTSGTGAALRDILNVLGRRYPDRRIVIAPVKVQGEGAAEEIARAIDDLNRLGGVDVMIVGRGGGSLEDLWAFNEEVVARAIARSVLPVISAVGHEIDFTISDFVADVRAPTPSAAAELVIGEKAQFEEAVRNLRRKLERAMGESLLRCRARLDRSAGSYVFHEPAHLVERFAQRIDACALRMERVVGEYPTRCVMRLRACGVRLSRVLDGRTRAVRRETDALKMRARHALTDRMRRDRQDLRRLEGSLRALDPTAVLRRGFSLTYGPDGHIVRDAATLTSGEGICTKLGRGRLKAQVTSIEREDAV